MVTPKLACGASRNLLWIGLLATLGACESTEERDWRLAQEDGSFGAFKRFLGRYRSSPLAASALRQLWQRAQDMNTLPAYESFLRADPEPRHRALAEQAIWKIVEQTNSANAYQEFLDEHAKSPLAAAARDAWWQLTEREGTMDAYLQFLERNAGSPQGAKASEVVRFLWPTTMVGRPTCTLASNLAVDLSWSRVPGAQSYVVDWSPSPRFRKETTQWTLALSTWKKLGERAGSPDAKLPMYYRISAIRHGVRTLPSEPCLARLLPSKHGTACQICGEKAIGYCHLRRTFVCRAHATFTDEHGQRWRCP